MLELWCPSKLFLNSFDFNYLKIISYEHVQGKHQITFRCVVVISVKLIPQLYLTTLDYSHCSAISCSKYIWGFPSLTPHTICNRVIYNITSACLFVYDKRFMIMVVYFHTVKWGYQVWMLVFSAKSCIKISKRFAFLHTFPNLPNITSRQSYKVVWPYFTVGGGGGCHVHSLVLYTFHLRSIFTFPLLMCGWKYAVLWQSWIYIAVLPGVRFWLVLGRVFVSSEAQPNVFHAVLVHRRSVALTNLPLGAKTDCNSMLLDVSAWFRQKKK